jgi:hypothetical protein
MGNVYSFSAVLAATNYQWKAAPMTLYTYVDRAAFGGTNLSFDVSPGYAVITNTVPHPGTLAYHLAHPAPRPQTVEIDRLLRPVDNAQLRFASRLARAMSDQVARVQVSTDGGTTWLDLWSQPGRGNGDPGEASFRFQTNSLSAFAGFDVRLRFIFDFESGSYFPQTSEGFGWYFDEITFDGVEEVLPATTNLVDSASAFIFVPGETVRYELRVRALLPGRVLPFGPPLAVTAGFPPPHLSFLMEDGNLRLRWPTNQPGYTLQRTPTVTLTNSWSDHSGTPSVHGANFEVMVGTGPGTLFFRLRKP